MPRHANKTQRNEVCKAIKIFYWHKTTCERRQIRCDDNKDKFITAISRKTSLRKPSASTIPNEVTVPEKNNEHLSSLAMLTNTHLIHIQSKAKL